MAEERLWFAREPAPRVADGPFPRFTLVCSVPTVWAQDDFAGRDEIDAVLAASTRFTAQHPGTAKHDHTGESFELPIDGDPTLETLRDRMSRTLGTDDRPSSFRYRRYAPGEGHGSHCDHFQMGDRWLVATAMLCLSDVPEGGATTFHGAVPPVSVRPRAGRLIAWLNHRADATPDHRSVHEGTTVVSGSKVTVTAFLYQDPMTYTVLRDRMRHQP